MDDEAIEHDLLGALLTLSEAPQPSLVRLFDKSHAVRRRVAANLLGDQAPFDVIYPLATISLGATDEVAELCRDAMRRIIERTSPDEFFWSERSARHSENWSFRLDRAATNHMSASHLDFDEGLLLACTAASSGFLRMEALQRIAKDGSGGPHRVFAFLARVVDWVEPVRAVADHHLATWLAAMPICELKRYLPALFHLEQLRRIDGSIAVARALGRFQSQEGLSALQELVISSDRQVARRALRFLATSNEPELANRMEEILAASTDPVVRSIAASTIVMRSGRDLSPSALTLLVNDTSPRVRHLAVAWVGSNSPDGARELLRSACLDPSKGVRQTAAFFARKVFGEDVDSLYTKALESAQTKTLIAAILGIGESSNSPDFDRLAEFVGHERPSVVLAALAVLRQDGDTARDTLFAEHAMSMSRRIARMAAEHLVTRHPATAYKIVRELEQSASATHHLTAVFIWSRLGGKWARLRGLLHATSGKKEPMVVGAAVAQLRRWLLHANRSYSTCSVAERAEISTLLAPAESSIPSDITRRLKEWMQ